MSNTEKIRILIVEDNPSDLFLIQQGFFELKDFDHELVPAGKLSDSIELLSDHKFDIALLDLGLPDSQGLDTFRKFNVKSGQLPVLILTGMNDVTTSIAALREGAQDYLVKNKINTPMLSQSIRHALERNKLNTELRKSYDRMRLLAQRLQHIQEEERKRLSRDVHDGLGQLLTALKIDLNWIKKNTLSKNAEPQDIIKRVNDSEELVNRAITSVQEIAINLRPNTLDQLGISEAIRDESRRFQARTSIEMDLELHEHIEISNPHLSTAIFRIFQELLTNIARHAKADKVQVRLVNSDNHLILDVMDNGIGIPEGAINASTSIGLLGIFERASEHGGHVSIFNGESGGAHFSVNLPLGKGRGHAS